MSEDWQTRTRMLLDDSGIHILEKSSVLIVGLGGVGGFVAEFLCRAGTGKLILVDGDDIRPSNRNRQIQATVSTEGLLKSRTLEERLKQINPKIQIECITNYLDIDTIDACFSWGPFDFVVDAIDTLNSKILLIERSLQEGFPLVSSFGSAGKLDPLRIEIADLSRTYDCRLAKHVRKRLKKRGITGGFLAVFSPEPVDREKIIRELADGKASTVGTVSYMPPAFGAAIASVVIRKLLGKEI